MEAKTDIQSYLEQGKQALAQGQGREAAIAYAHAAQIEGDNPIVHLGLAEANLALGNYGVVQMACRRVQELQPTGGSEGMTAQAILDLLDRRYDRALQYADAVIAQDPSIAYIHALRSYLLRAQGQDYDANLARARAARLSYGGRFEDTFPALEPRYISGYAGQASVPPVPPNPEPQTSPSPTRSERESIPTWSRPNAMQRQMVRARFAMSQYPGLITYIIIAINFAVFLVVSFLSGSLLNADGNVLQALGAEVPLQIIESHEYWRILTAMFLHAGLLHVALNMLSLFFIGRVIEMLYGSWRYLLIYFAAGIVGGLTVLVMSNLSVSLPALQALFHVDPMTPMVGASGAIFGIFGALGIFYFLNRHTLGMYSRGAMSNWTFWLVLNLVWGFSFADISIAAHLGGLVAGLLLGWLLLPKMGKRSL